MVINTVCVISTNGCFCLWCFKHCCNIAEILYVKRIAILASGAGSNAANIIQYFKSKSIAEVVLVASNKADAGVLQIAASNGIPTEILTKQNFVLTDDFVNQLRSMRVDLIVLAGFLWKVPAAMVAHFPQQIVNIHPSLLPKYGGKGMYGHFVHEAVHAAREKESGITVHWVNEHYDEGAIIAKRTVSIFETDTVADIERKVRTLEMEWFPKVLEEVLMSC
jgi:phosphoribosylglycinamide formyltransferase-1